MATITTKGEQQRIGRLKEAVGGYDEMERLLQERRRVGPNAQLRRDANGRLNYVSAVAAQRATTNTR